MPDPFVPFDILILPCRDNAGPDHWQSHWQKAHPAFVRVVQDDWITPRYASWAMRLDDYVARADRPVILIAHSLGTSLVMRWAHQGKAGSVAGAFLVAPSDRDAADIWPAAHQSGFAPMVLDCLPFPAVVLASRNDPYVAFDRADLFAQGWGADLIDLGLMGHLGNDDSPGPWPEGLAHLRAFATGLPATRQRLT